MIFSTNIYVTCPCLRMNWGNRQLLLSLDVGNWFGCFGWELQTNEARPLVA